MNGLLPRLRERGWLLTAQRRVIAEVLTGDHLDLTADEMLVAARTRLPEVGRATVYATLRELVELGEPLEVITDRDPVRYDPDAVAPHEPLVCVGCGQVLDVPSESPSRAAPHRHGYRIDTVEVTFRGHCPSCRETAPA